MNSRIDMHADTGAGRRHDIDWLRVVATYLVIFFHVVKVFDVAPFYHIKNSELSLRLDLLSTFIHLWHMPLFFALAGWSLHASIKARGSRNMLKERSRRLLLPATAGIVLLCPVIKYFELRSGLSMGLYGFEHLDEPIREGFLAFLPSFASPERFTWAHLWFLVYLFTFTMLYRRLFARLIVDPGGWAEVSRARLYKPLLVFAGIQMTLRLLWPGGQNLVWDWANFAFYSSFFILGFVLARCPAWQAVIAQEWKRCGTLAAVCYALLAAYWVASGGEPWPSQPSLGAILRLIPILGLTGVAGYLSVVFMFGFAARFLHFGGRVLAYLSDSSLPVYILHQAAIVVPGYFLLKLDLAFATKFCLLLLASYTVTLSVYHFVVRPTPLLRPLFGMKALSCSNCGGRVSAYSLAAAAALALILLPATASAQGTLKATGASPLGLWYAEHGSAKVEVRACDDALCGKVVWLSHPLDGNGCQLRDVNNPDPTLRQRLVEGIEIISGFALEPDADGVYRNGSVYDPGSGHRYSATVRMDGEDRLELRGYLGLPLFGRTSRWFRVGSEDKMCRVVHADPSHQLPVDVGLVDG